MLNLDIQANSNWINSVLIPELCAANEYWNDAVAVTSGGARCCARAAQNNLDATLGTSSRRLGRRWTGYHGLRNDDLVVSYVLLLSHLARHRSEAEGTSLHISLIAFRNYLTS